MRVLSGRIALARQCAGVYESISLISSSLLFQLLGWLTWKCCKIGGIWPNSGCFVGCCSLDLLTTVLRTFVLFPFSFFSMCFVSVHVVYPYSGMDIGSAWKKSIFISSDRSDFHNLWITFYAFAWCMLTSLLIDERLLLRYVNWSTTIVVLYNPYLRR